MIELILFWFLDLKERLFPPGHDCREHLPEPEQYPVGSMLACPVCRRFRVRDEYWDDDLWGGTGLWLTWRPARPEEHPAGLASDVS